MRLRRLRDKFKTVSRLLEAEEHEQLISSIKSESAHVYMYITQWNVFVLDTVYTER